MRRLTIATLACAVSLATVGSGHAAVLYNGGFYSQNFDTLPSTPVNASLGDSPLGWIDDTASPASGNYSIPGVYIWHPIASNAEAGANGHQRLRISGTPTTSATGSYYSYGEAASSDRALGAVPSGTIAANNEEIYSGVRLTNNTSQTLTQFSFSYTGEQWRVSSNAAGGAAGNQSVTVDYRLGGTDLQTGPYTEIPSATFDSPVDTLGSSNHLNGNSAANRVMGLGAAVTGISWAPGTDLWLRFTQINAFNTGVGEIADHGLAVDDLTFIGEVPEPSALVLAVGGAVALLTWRRK